MNIMKKLYIYILFILGLNINDAVGQINAYGVPTTLCSNESFSVYYTYQGGVANAGNEFRVQISDMTGTFSPSSNLNIIGFITSTELAGAIYVTIPYNTPFNGNYRLRVIATNTNFGIVVGNPNSTGPISIWCQARDYYWIGGTGNWSDLSHWEYTDDDGSTFNAAFEVPQPDDNANFDSNSFPSGGTLTFDQFIDITNFYWELGSGASNPLILAQGNTIRLEGDLVLDAGVVTDFSEIQYNSNKTHIEINYADNILASTDWGGVSFSGGGSWYLNSDMNSSNILIHDGSKLVTNDYQLTINGQIWANGAIGNTLETGSSDIYLGDLTSNNMSITGDAIWYLNGGGSFGDNLTTGTVIIESGDYYFNGINTIDELILLPGTGIIIRDVYPLSITSNFEAIGTRDKLVTIESMDPGIQATLNITPGASFIADFISINDNIITGNPPYSPDNWVENGNNTGWDFNVLNKLTGLNYYWVGGSGNWSDYSTHWARLDGGGGFRASPPGAVDNIFFTSASFPVGGTIFVDSDVECNTMEWQAGSGITNPKIRGGSTITVNDNFTLDNGVTRSVNFNFQTDLGQTQNLNFADNLFESGSINLTGEGTWDLLSDLEVDELNLSGGTFNTNDHQIDVNRIYVNDDTGVSNWGTSTINLYELINQTGNSTSFSPQISIFNFGTSSESFTRLRGPFDLNEVNIIGNSSIENSNQITILTIEKGSTLTLEQNTTQWIFGSLTAIGLRDQPISIKSDNPGVIASFSQFAGSNTTSFLIIEDVNTIGAVSINTDYSTYDGIALSGGTLFNGWIFGQLLDTPLDFYWVGNSGNWSDYSNHWATSENGSSMHIFAPGSGDNVFFTPSSFTSTGQAVTLDNPVTINDMTWNANSGNNSPAITAIHDYNQDIYNPLTVSGDLTFAPGVIRNIDNLILESSDPHNVDFADNNGTFDYPDQITFRGGGTWDLQSDLETYELNIEDATLNTNDFDIDLSNGLTLYVPSSIVNLGTSDVYLRNLNDNSGGGSTFSATNSFIYIYDNANIYGNFALNYVQVFDGGELSVGTSLSINNLTLDPGSILTIGQSNILTTNSLSADGSSDKPIRIQSNVNGNQGFISQAAGTVNASYLLISDNDVSGGATFNLTNSLVTGNPANVTGWNITPAPNYIYNWIGGSGNWSDIAHWEFSTDGGSNFNPAVSPPGMSDDVFINSTSFTGPGEQIVIDQPAYCNDMEWSTTLAQSPTLSGIGDVPLTVFGSFILSNGVYRNIPEINFESYVAGNIINMADNLTAGLFDGIDFEGSGEWTLTSDLKAREVNFRGGTFNTADFDLYVDSWSFNNSSAKEFNAGTSHIYSSEFTKDNNGSLTFNPGTSTLHVINSNENSNEIDGPFNFYDVIIEEDAELRNSNSFISLTINSDVNLVLEENQVQFVTDLALNGLSGSPVTVASSSEGNQGTFFVPGAGSVTANYVIFQDNSATTSALGGVNFNATNSSEISNVTGWSGLLQGQTINFLSLNDIDLSGTIDLEASSSSGLAVTYSVSPITGSGSVSTDVLTPSGVGLVAVIASQAGNGSYGAAQDVIRYVHFNEGINANELGQMKEASYVVGAPNGVSEGTYDKTDKSTSRANHSIVSPDGKLIVGGEGRVMIWNQLPDAYDVPADVVVGQLDFFSDDQNASQTVLAPLPDGASLSSTAIGPNGELIVSDGRGVLIWNSIPTTNGAPADVIIGQTNFTSTTMDVAQDKFLGAGGLAVSNDGKLIICELAAHRVLIFNTIPTTNGAAADVVIGQPDFVSSSPGSSQTSFNTPAFAAVTPDNKLLITDAFNNRIMVYNTIPTTNNAPADVVIGQNNFTSNGAGVSGNSFNIPIGVDVSRTGKLAISDLFNARVLIYNQVPADNTAVADLVLGQPDFSTNDPVNEDEITLRDMGSPFGVAWDQSENLIITDGSLERVLVYGAADLTAPAAFTTGLATIVGSTVTDYWIATSTAIDVTVPITNDQSLNGGTIQLEVKIGVGAYENIGALTTILGTSLGSTQVINISSAQLTSATGFGEGATITLRAVLTDVVNNSTTGAESTSVITVDRVAPTAFTTGLVSSVGGTVVAGYWSGTNTSMDVLVPIDNDTSLDGGNLQMQVKIGSGAFVDIGSQISLTSFELGNTLIPSIIAADLIASVDYAQNASIVYRASITDVAGNQTIGTESSSTSIIDTVFPIMFTTGNVAVVGGTVISNVWNSSNTSINVTVPIENEASLDGGGVLLQVKFAAGSFIDVGSIAPIISTDLGGSIIINITKAEFEAAGGVQGEKVSFTSKISDVAGNHTTGTESSVVITIDNSASAPFDTQSAVTIGGSVNSSYWNTTNTSIDVSVEIKDDAALVGGNVQMQIKIGSGSFTNAGTAIAITEGDRGTSKVISVSETDLETLPDYVEGASIFFRATITTIGGNQSIGAESPTSLLIDTIVPADFTTGVITTTGQPEFVVAGFWNANNDGVEVSIIIDNDPSLVGGSVQLSMAIDGGSFIEIGTTSTITASDITNASLRITLTKADFEGLSGLDEGSIVSSTATITDIAGNPQPGTESNTELTIDRVAPAINFSNSTIATTHIAGSNTPTIIDFAAEISGIENIAVTYRFITDNPEETVTVPLTDETDGTYIFDLDVIDVANEKLGIEYYLEANDYAGNTFTTIGSPTVANIRYPSGITVSNYGVGNATEDYRLFTIPLDMDNSTVNSVFSGLIGSSAYDPSKMRIYTYSGGSNFNEANSGGFSNFEMGKGYFGLALTGSSTSINTGIGETVFPFSKTLANGWNLIGNPYDFNISWGDILSNSGLTNELAPPVSYTGDASWPAQDILEAGKGYFVNNVSGGSVILEFPLLNHTGGRLSSHIEENNNELNEESWEVRMLILNKEGNKVPVGAIGMELDANFSIDFHDRINPPTFAKQEMIEFNHPEFFQSSFRNDIRETASEEKWRFEYKIEDNEMNKHELFWDNSYFGNNSPDLYLVDKTHFATINMKDVNSYSFNHSSVTSFEVYFGLDMLEHIIPSELITQSPFPNPFNNEITFNLGLPQDGNYSVQIRIFDSVGKMVRVISEDNFKAGYNSMVWDGLNKDGGLIPNGIYAYSIHIKSDLIDLVKNGKIIKR